MTGLVVFVLLAQAAAVPAEQGTLVRSVDVRFVDRNGGEVGDLSATDIALEENGVVRDVASFAPDMRPLALAILVDTSAAAEAGFRHNVVDAVNAFVTGLPEGARFTLWTTGERPTKAVEMTRDRSAAAAALRRAVFQGGNTVLDALAEASDELAELAGEGERKALLVVSTNGPELSHRERESAAEETAPHVDLVLAAEIQAPSLPGSEEPTTTNVTYALDSLAKRTGGRYDMVLTPMGIGTSLHRLGAVLRASYRLSYVTVPGLSRRKLSLTVARPGTKALLPARPTPES